MFDTEDVDDDFFTPSKSSTLANIFGKKNKVESNENPSLKYVAPKAEDVSSTSQSQPQSLEKPTKKSECLLAFAVFAYEWTNGVYNSKDKLGFAIMKILTPPQIRLVLYDAGKNTLSYAVVSSSFEVTVHKNNCISYVDEARKNWSLICSTHQNVENVLEELQKFNVKIIKENDSPNKLPLTQEQLDQCSNKIVEEHTENHSSPNSKASIISRMALMGQAILPMDHTKEPTNENKNFIHKNSNIKTNNVPERGIDIVTSDISYEFEKFDDTIQNIKTNDSLEMPSYVPLNRQIVPLNMPLKNNHCDNCQNFSAALSEQRISNSELRMNISKMEYKIDQLAGLYNLNTKSSSSNINDSSLTTDLTRKLLTEYENKIKHQDECIKQLEARLNLKQDSNDTNIAVCNNNKELLIQLEQYIEEIKKCKSKMKERQETVLEHFAEIDNLKSEVISLLSNKKDDADSAHKELSELISLRNENKELQDISEKKIKLLMNNTYHTLSACFGNDEQYSGDNIKRIIAKTIKELTMKNISK